MAKHKITDYSTTASSNSDIGGVGAAGTNAASNMDDLIRELASHLAETNAGTYPVADTWSFADPADLTKIARLDCGSITTATTRVITVPDADITLTGGNPPSDDGAALGTTALGWSDLHLATGAVINAANGNAVITHSSGIWTVSTGDWRVTTAGTNAASVVTVGGTQTLTGKTATELILDGSMVEDIYTISDGAGFAIDPANGTYQKITLGADRTPTASGWTSGQSVVLKIADGTAYAITWTTIGVVWIGGSAPALATSGFSYVVLWLDGSTYYGKYIGDSAT
jgi:hypothetical protein